MSDLNQVLKTAIAEAVEERGHGSRVTQRLQAWVEELSHPDETGRGLEDEEVQARLARLAKVLNPRRSE